MLFGVSLWGMKSESSSPQGIMLGVLQAINGGRLGKNIRYSDFFKKLLLFQTFRQETEMVRRNGAKINVV